MENKTSLAEATLPQIRQMVLENTERINRHELTLNRMLMEQQKQSRETGEQRYSLENSRKEFDRQISDINATLDRVAKMTEEYRADMRELKQQSKESDARIEKFRQESDARIEKFRQESEKRSEEYKQQVFAEMRQHNKETDERIEKFRQESDERIEKFRKESERRTEEYKQQVFAEMRQHNKETDERIEKFRQESDERIEKFRQESDERIEKFRQESDARIEAHRKAIDARIEKDWEKIKKEREDFKKFKREFYGLTWHITEGLVSSSTEKIFKKAGFNLQNSGKNIKRKLTAENKQMEIDVLLSGENLVVPVEVKTDFTHKDLEHFLKQMKLFRELFPEHDGKEVIAAVASFNYDNGVDALAHEQGLLVIRVSSEEIFSLDPVDRETLRRF